MNIFATSKSPVRSAQYLDDQRVVKMILESCQMLSTAAHSVKFKGDILKPTHINHPCNLWARNSADNFCWLLEHAIALDQERLLRFSSATMHKSLQKLMYAKIWRVQNKLPHTGLHEFANCARNQSLGIDFSHVYPVTKAYRLYLQARWRVSPPKFSS